MAKQKTASQRSFKKRLKSIAKSKARRIELNKKQKQRVEYIAKEVQTLRKKREKEFFRALDQRKQTLKLRQQLIEENQIPDDTAEKEIESRDDINEENGVLESNTDEVSKIAVCEELEKSNEAVVDECDVTDQVDNETTSDYCSVVNLQSRDVSSGLVALKSQDELFKFHGHARVTVLKGSCFINGFKMKSGDTQIVYAPVTHPAMVIKLSDDAMLFSKQQQSFDILPESEENYQVVILFQSLEMFERPGVLPGYENIYDLASMSIPCERQVCSTCWQCETERHFVEHEFYDEVFNSLSSYSAVASNNPHTHPVAVTVGGKNVGKSTLNRYLINRLLERHPHVYYFECDIGQSEFTPSGFISIHKIEQNHSLLGPPYTHQSLPKYCCFYGNNNPQGNPTRYMESVEYLFDSFLRDHDGSIDAPLIVNTMGWIRNIGSLLLVDIIRKVMPTHVFQFETSVAKLNHYPLTRVNVRYAEGWLGKTPQNISSYEHIVMNITDSYPREGKYKASDNRVMSLLSNIERIVKRCHLQQGLRSGFRCLRDLVQAINPYCVSLSKVALCNSQDKTCSYKFALGVFNASPVALCVAPIDVVDKLKNISEDDVIPEPPVCHCVGFGIVRGVDVKANMLYIVSDLQLAEIKQVNCIVRGDFLLSEAFFTNNQKSRVDANQPYISSSFPFDTAVGSNAFHLHPRSNKPSVK